MKYLLKPIGPNGETFEFDTNDIFHLSLLGRSFDGVVYFDGVPYTIESKPGYKAAPPTKYVRDLEAALLAMKKERDEIILAVRNIVNDTDTSNIIAHEDGEHYLLYWQNYVALHKIAATKEGEPAQTNE